MSDTDSLSSETIRSIADIQSVLEQTPRRVEKGCIVKIAVKDIFSPVTAEQKKSFDHIYGIVDNLADACEHSGLRSWTVNWFIISETILPDDSHDLSYLVDQLETDLTVVNWPEDEWTAHREDFRLYWFLSKMRTKTNGHSNV